MAGHSQFSNIMHRKGAQDAKRAKIFTRVGREIMVAVKTGGGPDPDGNPALRSAIQSARAVNMPKDRIDRAIKRGSGADGEAENFEEVRYEGYGNGGVAVIVETLTDTETAQRQMYAPPSPSMAGLWAKPIPSPSCSIALARSSTKILKWMRTKCLKPH